MNWKTALANFIDSRSDDTFQWGVRDCCLFAADAWLLICGIDLAATFRGRYSNRKEAYILLKDKYSGGLLEGMKRESSLLDLEEIKINFRQNGDLCVVDTSLGDALGIIWNGRAVVQGLDGLIRCPNASIKSVFRHAKLEVL